MRSAKGSFMSSKALLRCLEPVATGTITKVDKSDPKGSQSTLVHNEPTPPHHFGCLANQIDMFSMASIPKHGALQQADNICEPSNCDERFM